MFGSSAITKFSTSWIQKDKHAWADIQKDHQGYFLFRFDRELGLDLRGFAPEALELLQQHSWPGNVRELQSEIKQAMLNASGHIILPEFLSAGLRSTGVPPVVDRRDACPTVLDLDRLIDTLLEKGKRLAR